MPSDRPWTTDTSYDKPGTVPPPGPIGRLVRLVFGLGAFFVIYQMVIFIDDALGTKLPVEWLLIFLMGAYVFPYVVNLGYGLSLKSRPRTFALGLILVGIGISFLTSGNPWAPWLGWAFAAWLIYTYAHLGIAFLLSAAISTPGCEMRSIPHLISKLTGNATSEHYCPGPLDPIDRWEQRRS